MVKFSVYLNRRVFVKENRSYIRGHIFIRHLLSCCFGIAKDQNHKTNLTFTTLLVNSDDDKLIFFSDNRL